MEKEVLYNKVLELMKKLDSQFEKEAKLKGEMNKTESLKTYLFSTPPKLLEESEKVTEGLITEIKDVVKKLNSLGYAINGRTYALEEADNEKRCVGSAKYGFVVQY